VPARGGTSLRATGATVALLAMVGAIAVGCGGDGEDEPAPDPAIEASTGETRTDSELPVGAGSGGVRLVKLGEFEQPLYVTQPPGSEDRYVVEQTGRVRIVRDGRVLPDPFLDLSGEVSAGGEQGLLSIAFDPAYEDSGLLYAYYTDRDEDQRIVEFEAGPGVDDVDEGARREILRMEDFASNHNGGLLLFGPDGHLYVGTGDGGGSGDPERNGQDLGSLLGKLLRIDPGQAGGRPYGIPADNPFRGRSGARPEVYSYGLRNPWRFSFDRETEALSIGDVGQNAFEEIDFVAAGGGRGANFGWSAFEGEAPFNSDQSASGHVPPALVYGREDGCSVTGGYVVRDRALRSLYGRYLYGDFCAGELRSFVPRPGRARGDRPLGLTVPQLSSFGEDRGGRIYVTSLSGPVFRLAPG
jgi:glucose/arabinose dehydrogenase